MLSLVDAERSYLLTAAPGALASDSLSDLQAKFWTKTATESLADAETRYLKALLSNEAAGDSLADLRRKDLILKTGATSGSDSELKALYLGVPTVKNLLTANQASGGDTLGNTSGIWQDAAIVARTTSQAYQGTGSISVTSTSGGSASLVTDPGASGIIPGITYTASAATRAASAARDVRIQILWMTIADAFISVSSGSDVPNSSSGWSVSNCTAVAPLTAAKALIYVTVLGTNAAEIHYVDAVGFWSGVGPDWVMP